MGNTIYASGRTYLLELGGQPVGTLHSFTQGNLVADLSQSKSSNAPKSSQFSMGDIELSCGAGMNRLLQEWIRNALDRSYARKDGSVTVMDINQKAASSVGFYNALLTEFSTPALDKAAKSEGYFTISIRPERVLMRSGQSFDPKKLPGYGSAPRSINTSKYKLAIDGLEKECAEVTKIDALTVRVGISIDNVGREPSPHIELSGRVDESDLVLTIPASSIGGFKDWFLSAMAQGTQSEFKNGSLEYFAADTDKRELRLEFKKLGIKSLSLSRKDDFTSKEPATIHLFYDSVSLPS